MNLTMRIEELCPPTATEPEAVVRVFATNAEGEEVWSRTRTLYEGSTYTLKFPDDYDFRLTD